MTAPLTMRLPSRKAGVWVQVFETLAEKSPDSMQFIDSSIIRAHQQAAVQSGVMLLTLAG